MGKFVEVAKASEVPSGETKCVEIEGCEIALFNLDGEFYAIGNTCTHEGGPLCDGELEGDEVECPWHGARFEVKTGRVTLDPAEDDVPTYNVRRDGDSVLVEL